MTPNHANDNQRPAGEAFSAIVGLATDVFAGLLSTLATHGQITAAEFAHLTRQTCEEYSQADSLIHPEVTALLGVVEALSPRAAARKSYLVLSGPGHNAHS